MNPVEPQWVVLLMGLMTAVGAIVPKLKEWFFERKKQQLDDLTFILNNYKGIIEIQDQKFKVVEAKLSETLQKLVDVQTACVSTTIENLKMKEQIKTLTTENNDLQAKVADIERRVPK